MFERLRDVIAMEHVFIGRELKRGCEIVLKLHQPCTIKLIEVKCAIIIETRQQGLRIGKRLREKMSGQSRLGKDGCHIGLPG